MAHNLPTMGVIYPAIGTGTAVNTAPWNPNTTIMPGMLNTPLVAASSQTVRKRALRPWEKGLFNLSKRPRRSDLSKVYEWYRGISTADTISELGFIRPMFANRPSAWIMPLLTAATVSVTAVSNYRYFLAGLMYRTPFVAGRKKTGFKLSVSGLELLEHFASKSKAFKKFFDLYVPKKARKQIYQDCFDFQMNALPKSHTDTVIKHAEAMAKIDSQELESLRSVARSIDWPRYIQQQRSMLGNSSQFTGQAMIKIGLLQTVVTHRKAIMQSGGNIVMLDAVGKEHIICPI